MATKKAPKAGPELTKEEMVALAGLLKRLSETIYKIAVDLEAMRLRLEAVEQRTGQLPTPPSA